MQPFDGPVYLQYPEPRGPVYPGMTMLYLLTDLRGNPKTSQLLQINDDDTVSFYSEWDGGGIIQRLGPNGEPILRTPYHSCKVLNPLFERKEYECLMHDQKITVYKPEDTEPPMDVTELLSAFEQYVIDQQLFIKPDLSKLFQPDLKPMLYENDLAFFEVMDKHFIEVLKTAPLPQAMLDQLNRREKLRGKFGDYKNAPDLVSKYAKLDADNRREAKEAQKERERKVEEENQRMQALYQAEQDLLRTREIELEGEPIHINQSEATLSPDATLLPGCTQLWNSPDIPLQGDNYYIGNCIRVESQRVCTFKLDSQQADENCTPLSMYQGGVITPPIEAYSYGKSIFTPEELLVLYHGAGMTPEQISIVRQPVDPPPLFVGTRPTQWNLYLRQVPQMPVMVPDELR